MAVPSPNSMKARVPWALAIQCLKDSLLHADIHPLAAILATGLAGHGYRKGSLSTSGASVALVVGYLTMANPLPTFGLLLIAFYLAGSKATKVKADLKAKLEREDEYRTSVAHKSAKGGGRDAWQVLCNGLVGCLAAVLFRLTLSPPCVPYQIRLQNFCPLTMIPALKPAPTPRSYLILALAHFSACMGDTLASELGILSRSRPFLFFSTRPRIVPAGTNGGMSVFGTAASAVGGLWLGFVFVLSLFISSPTCLQHLSRTGTTSGASLDGTSIGWMLLLATASGLIGSLVDSALGATLQKTWYNTKTKQVLLGSRQHSVGGIRKEQDKEWVVITGHDVLSNNQVNVVSSFFTALAAVSIDRLVWG